MLPEQLLEICADIGLPKDSPTDLLSADERRALIEAKTVATFAQDLGISPDRLLAEMDEMGLSTESADIYLSTEQQSEIACPVEALAREEGVAPDRLLRELEAMGQPKHSAASLVTAKEQEQLATFARVHRTALAIRAFREYRGYTRAHVSAELGVSERQLAKIEAGEVELIDDDDPKQADRRKALAAVLGVQVKDLSGRTDTARLILDANPHTEATAPISAILTPHARAGFARIRDRYGWSIAQVMEVAPLMFVLLAEGSLDRRSRQLGEMRSAHDAAPLELRRFLSDFRERLEAERASIQDRSLRQDSFSGGASLDPFSAHLYELAGTLGEEADVPFPPASDPRRAEQLLLDWLMRDDLRCPACHEPIELSHVHCPWCGEPTARNPVEGY